MTEAERGKLITAMMFLEMAFDPTEKARPLAEDFDLVAAAHGFVQAAINGTNPGPMELELLAKIRTAVALEDAMRAA